MRSICDSSFFRFKEGLSPLVEGTNWAIYNGGYMRQQRRVIPTIDSNITATVA